jgi:uncharacterized coiled-coil protein SlyX
MPSAGSVRSISTFPGRLAELERTVADVQQRLGEIESSLAALESIRDEVRRSTEELTEALNRVAAEAATPT